MKKLMICLTMIGLVSCSSDNLSSELNNEISQEKNTQSKGTLNKEDFFKSAFFFRGNMIDNSSSDLLITYKMELERRYNKEMSDYDNHINYLCQKLIEKNPNIYNDFYDVIVANDYYASREFIENISLEVQNIFVEDPKFSDIKDVMENIKQNVDFSQSNLQSLDFNKIEDIEEFQNILKDEYNIDLFAIHNKFNFFITYPVWGGIVFDIMYPVFFPFPTPVFFPGLVYSYVLPAASDSANMNVYINEVSSLL